MYDFQIIVPCVKNRLEIFQKFGLHNTKNTKILVYCLVNTKEEFLEGWPENVDVKFIEFFRDDFDDPAHKIYHFLSNFTLEQAQSAKWTLKIDDDSYNDFYNMKKLLDELYDYEKDFYLVGEIRHENNHVELSILKTMNLLEKYKVSGWQHELEACIFSRSAMEKIIQNKDCKELFKKRSLIRGSHAIDMGFTDQCMGLAASFCKIYPTLTHLILSSARDEDLKLLTIPYEERRYDEKKDLVINKKNQFVHYHPIKSGLELLELFEIEDSIKKIKEKYEKLKIEQEEI